MQIPPILGGYSQPAPQAATNPFAALAGLTTPQGSGMGGFMGRAAQQGGSMPIRQLVLSKEAEKLRESSRKLQEKANMQYQQAAELEAPKAQNPMTGGEAGIGGLIMLIAQALGGGQGASEFMQGFMQSRAAMAGQNNEDAMRRYQMQTQRMGQLADIDMNRAKLEMSEADRIQGRLDAENAALEKQNQMRDSKMWTSINALQQQLDNAPYDRIVPIVNTLNAMYDKMGMPELKTALGDPEQMKQEAKRKHDEAQNVKKQGARTSLLRAIMPYVPAEGRGELMDWVANLRDADLEVSMGMSEAELNQRARTEGQKYTNQIKQAEAAVAKEFYQNRVKLQEADYDFIRTKIKYYPQTIQMAMARFQVQSALAGNTFGNTAFDNAMTEWKARTGPYVDQLGERAKQVQAQLDQLAKNVQDAPEDKRAELQRKQNATLTDLTKQLNAINAEIMRVSQSAPKADRFSNPEAPMTPFGGEIGFNFNPNGSTPPATAPNPSPKPTPTSPKPSNNPKPGAKEKSRTVNVGGTTVKVTPVTKKGK